MPIKKQPCKDCPKRSLNPPCHDICSDYQEYKAENQKIRDTRRREKLIESVHIDMIMRNIKRAKDGR